MNMSGIIKDSLRYPFSDWKKILILGFITLFSGLTSLIFFNYLFHIITIVTILLFLIGFLISFFILGYEYKIIKSTLDGTKELPPFNSWNGMFKDGIKNYIVHLIYLIPGILLLFVYPLYFLSLIRDPGPLTFIAYFQDFIRAFVTGTNFFSYFWFWVLILVVCLYFFIIIPILYMGLVNMIKNDGKLRAAFSFRKIFQKLTDKGLKNIIIWYLAIIIPYSILYLLKKILYLGNIYQSTGYVLLTLIVSSYLSMYFYKLVALFYGSEYINLSSMGSINCTDNVEIMDIDWKTLVIGVIIGLIFLFILPPLTRGLGVTITLILATILATIYVGYSIRGNFKNGAFNGAIVGVILAIILWIVTNIITNSFISDSIDPAIVLLGLIIYFSIFGGIGAIGSIIGSFIKRIR